MVQLLISFSGARNVAGLLIDRIRTSLLVNHIQDRLIHQPHWTQLTGQPRHNQLAGQCSGHDWGWGQGRRCLSSSNTLWPISGVQSFIHSCCRF